MSVSLTSAPATLASPLTEDRLSALARVTDGLDVHGLWWLSGYAAGLASRSAGGPAVLPAAIADAPAAGRLTVVYGSQTGNARRVAEQLVRQVEGAGLPVRLVRADS